MVTVGKRKPTSSSQRKARKEYKKQKREIQVFDVILKIFPGILLCNNLGFTTLDSIGWPQILHSFLLPTKKEEVHPLAHREYHSLRRIHVKVFSGKDEQP